MIELKQAHKSFINQLKNAKKSSATIIAYEKDIEQLVEFLSKQSLLHIHEVNLSHLESFMENLRDNGISNKTISRKTNATRTFFKFMYDSKHIEINISDDLKHPSFEQKPPRILSKLEYRALRDASRDDARSYAIIEILLQTGISISELAYLQIDHIEFDDIKPSGVVYIPARESKEDRKIPLNEKVVEAIKKYIREHRPQNSTSKNLFITKNGNPLLIRNIRSTIDRYFEIAGVKDAKVNDLRHTFIAHHLSQGVSLQKVSKIVGHKRISTTEKYLEYIERESESESLDLGIL